MAGYKDFSRRNNSSEEPERDHSKDHSKNNITIHLTFNIGNTDIHVEQRAEGGGQINKDVGTNANQGGQNALNGSHTRNQNSQFADGNGRSGIAGNDNDEAGGQQGTKVRDSLVIGSEIHQEVEEEIQDNLKTNNEKIK
ncbi:hypothetical protein ACQKII_12735 [Lysinibacillus sp. NPDC048646]|uniref:hypothetical protein n=1 Tax=Lysinibacillus sp. NPDC048646 TaxID=3390574 RepID=UPI003CFCF9F6